MKQVPPALRVARENANARMTGANATPQGYYKPSEKQKKFRWKPRTRALRGDQVLPEIYGLAALAHTFPVSHQGSGTRFQDGPKVHSGCHRHFTVC